MERGPPEIGVRRQCELLGVNRSGLYYEPVGESEQNLGLMRLLDEQYTRTPFYGSGKMTEWLATVGRSCVSQAEAEPARRRPSDLPVLAERDHGGARQPGVQHGYHLYPDGAGLRVSGGGHGLVQPVRTELVAVVNDGGGLLHRGSEACFAAGTTGDLQPRSGIAVHVREVHRGGRGATDRDRHGWVLIIPRAVEPGTDPAAF